MKLKVQHVMDATLVISKIIRDARAMPQKGKYRLARMHAKLLPEFLTINERRDAMIRAYDTRMKVPDPNYSNHLDPLNKGVPMIDGPEFTVPDDKSDEFNAAWKEIADEEIDVNVEPIPLAQLDLGASQDGSIEAGELITLGDLVKD